MTQLDGRVALVTGASGGIGAAIARQLAGQGGRLVLVGRRRDALEAVAAGISDSVVLQADLADPTVAPALVQEAEATCGASVAILVNNAGFTRDNLALRMKDEDFDSVLNVNLGAAFRLSRAVMRGMMKARWGRIINIGSVVGTTGNPGQANYVAAKAGLVGLTKSLAAELATRGITVNCVAPGFIATAMTDALTESQRAAILNAIPSGEMGQPQDVAHAVGFLATPEARYITGQTLHINGGLAMI